MEYISENGNLVRIKDIAVALGMKKSTVFTILETLQDLGYIEQDEISPRYRLTDKMQKISFCYPSVSYMKQRIRPILEYVSQEFDQTSYLAVQMGNYFQYELECKPKSLAHISLEVGKEYEMARTAIGKVFVAYSIHLQDVVRRSIEAISVTELTEILSDGYALDIEQYEKGLNCIAIPCFYKQHVVAVVGMSGSSDSFKQEKMKLAAACIRHLLADIVW